MNWIREVLANTAIANAASLLGVLTSFIGFAFTIWNVRRSRSAAEEARAAVIEVRRGMSRLDAVADVSAAITAMEEVKRLQRQLAWPVLPDRYANLRKHLISIKASFSDLTEGQRSTLQGAIQHFAGIENLLERTPHADLGQKKAARLNRTVSKQIDELLAVLIDIKNSRGQ